MEIVFIHDLVDPVTGKTFKELNLEKQHQFLINDLVEIIKEDDSESEYDLMRAYVIGLVRDCDGTPLYRLGTKGMELHPESEKFYNFRSLGSFSEECLKLILRDE